MPFPPITTGFQRPDDLILDSWHAVDYPGECGVDTHYSADAVFIAPAGTMTGIVEIAAGYAGRSAGPPRLSRHLVTNLIMRPTGNDSMTAHYVLTLFAGDGVAPLPLTGVSAVCDIVDELVDTPAGWLILRRELTPVFVAPENNSAMLHGVDIGRR